MIPTMEKAQSCRDGINQTAGTVCFDLGLRIGSTIRTHNGGPSHFIDILIITTPHELPTN